MSGKEIKKLQKTRESIRIKLEIFVKYVNSVFDEVTRENQDVPLIELNARLNNSEKILDQFEENQLQLESLLEDISDSEIEYRVDFENLFYSCVAKARQLLQISANVVQSTSNIHESDNSGIKLPTMQLPKFNGSYENWTDFYDSFDSIIVKNTNISAIQKFHYLKSCLSGSAEKIISSLQISASNFPIAWQLVCNRFSNKQLLIHNHIKSIFNLKPIREDSTCIRLLVDTLTSNLRSLESLGEPTEHWDSLIIYILLEKLDSDLVKDWDKESRGQSSRSLQDLLKFLQDRADTLEKFEVRSKILPNKFYNNKSKGTMSRSMMSKEVSRDVCAHCKGNHKIFVCNEFQRLNIHARGSQVKKLKLCFNCLYHGHQSANCKFGNCKKCGNKHHTLLHSSDESTSNSSKCTVSSEDIEFGLAQNASDHATKALSSNIFHNTSALLSTVVVQVRDSSGVARNCRALLDSGSQSNFVTLDFVSRLGLGKKPTNISVVGIANVSSNVKFTCNLTIYSLLSSFSTSLSCLIIPSICDQIPTKSIDISLLSIPTNIRLADPNFSVPSEIDLLIGVGHFWDLLCVGQVKLGPQRPILQNTKLGWIVSGPLSQKESSHVSSCNFAQNVDTCELSRFWEIEECQSAQILSKEELECEEHFRSTYQRDADGRFVVTIPLKNSVNQLGESRPIALKRFYNVERRLLKSSDIQKQYFSFVREYISLGHMSIKKDMDNSNQCYLPHHAVLKEDSLTTRLRVVFDGSCPTSSGISFNDLQLVGPVVQNDILSILLRFRQHSFVASADIEKMYRQILVHPSQRSLQQILWRFDPSEPLQTYLLNTVTYGTAAASFLSTRCILQLSHDCAESHPESSKIIANDFYVDDLLTGSDSVSDLIRRCHEVSDILSKGCFPLRKWVSNSPAVLEGLENCVSVPNRQFSFGSSENSKTLGLRWSPREDFLQYSILPISLPKTVTKRTILSGISQIFDPLGLLSATIIKVKVLMQRLWLEKLGWDQSVSLDIHSQWLCFRDQLQQLNDLKIPRHVILPLPRVVELHGFSDASESAYGAAIYLRSIDYQGKVATNLLCAKSKVAPLKKISVPRLELCGALILSRLSKKVIASLNLKFHNVYLWTDSTIVLGWINTSPHLLKTFVGNRVSEIQSNTEPANWRHVSSKDNPADLLSRGVEPTFIKSSFLWWHGPHFLSESSDTWPSFNVLDQEGLPELKKPTLSLLSVSSESLSFERFSNFNSLVRVIAYCLRFRHNCSKSRVFTSSAHLSLRELQNALTCIVKQVQRERFSAELRDLSHQKSVSFKSKIIALNPFIDEDGVIRVGGRIRNSNFSFDKKHPILLPAHHHITTILIRSEHVRFMHAGPQHLLSLIRQKFWPISGRSIARKVVRECIHCFRANPSQTNPIMGDLPSSRLSLSYPFAITGVDYSGPFMLKTRQGKKPSFYKAYVSLFICLSTKALHLELVTDLTSACFLAALKRFIARRGKPAQIQSDNGTNFVGCRNELRELGQFLKLNASHIVDSCTRNEIDWQFIPAHSPHFGGIWEAGVKSVKAHLKRVLCNAKLTYEDFSTVLTQIEGILNSRPLSPLSSDPSDILPITPAHFLIGRSMSSIPDANYADISVNRLTRFEHLQQLRQHFWMRWSLEYVSELQQRQKWKTNQCNIKIGTLVLIKDKNAPPLNWLLGRVERLHPGPDGVTRVVTLKTSNGYSRRAVNGICPLPL